MSGIRSIYSATRITDLACPGCGGQHLVSVDYDDRYLGSGCQIYLCTNELCEGQWEIRDYRIFDQEDIHYIKEMADA